MKNIWLVLIALIVLFAAPSLSACEKCYGAGSMDPAGNVHNYPSCYVIGTGEYTTCVSGYPSDTTCPYTTTGDGCPAGGQCQSVLVIGCALEPVSAPAPAGGRCSIDIAGRCVSGGGGRGSLLN